MLNRRTDAELLASFAETNDDIAFRELVSRYSGLLFHTALRSLRNQGLAEDVVQRVLLSLATKAGPLAKSPVALSAWLHRATILEAKSTRRAEMRQQRKKAALMHVPADLQQPIDSQWTDALPHLDAAIDRLPDADRTVILLHYVNGLTFPQIGATIGKSAAAVQKQSRRALEVLQRSLTRRGVTLSIGILAAGLTTEMAKAAPVLAIPAPAVLANLCKSKTSLFVVKKSSVLTLAATAILCGVPLARQQVTIHGLETRLTSIATADVAESRKAGSRGMTKLPSLIERLARDLNSKEFDMPIYLTATEHLAELDDAALAGLIRETISSSMSVSNREILLGHLLGILSERNVQASLDTLLEVVPIEYLGTSQRAKNMLANGIRILSEQDSQRALAWFNAHLEIIRTIPEPSVSSNDRLENHMRIALSQNLIFTNADQAIEVLRPVPSVQLVAQFPDLSQNNDPRMKKDASSYFQVVREVLPKENSIKIISDFVGMNALRNNFGTVDVLLETYEFTPEETDAIYISSGSWRLEPALLRDGGLEKTIHEYRTWLESKSSDAAERYIGQALGRTVQCWPSTIDPIYQAMLDSEKLGLGEQAVINLLATAGQQVGMERSTKLAEQISNPESARRLLAQIKKGGEP